MPGALAALPVLVRFGSIAMGYSNYAGGHLLSQCQSGGAYCPSLGTVACDGVIVFVLCRCVVLGPCTSLHWVPVRVLRARSRCSRRRCRRRRRVTMTGRVGDRIVNLVVDPLVFSAGKDSQCNRGRAFLGLVS